MLQLHNSTPFAADIALFPNEQGVDTLYIMAKATFEVGEQLTLAEHQTALQRKDEYYGEPQHSSLRCSGDYHLGKSGTDIIVNGDCIASADGPVRQCDVDIQVGPLSKHLRVFGDRVWDHGRISSPRPYERMPLTYDYAFGGTHYHEDGAIRACDQRNPAGLGFVPEPDTDNTHGLRLPNIEDPDQLIATVNDQPQPAGCGAIAPFWANRSVYAGTYDDLWQTERAPFLPLDFDQRFFQVASPGLIGNEFLRGGEPVLINNMTAAGHWSFDLPLVSLIGHVQWRKQKRELALDLETVELQPNHSRLVMTWRAAFMVNQQVLKLDAVTLKMQRAVAAQAR